MFLPLRTDSPLRHTPYMNWLLIAANVIVFGVQTAMPALTGMWELSPRDPHTYEFITYAFLHGGPLHLVGNMLFLFIFGNNVNDKMGNIGYLGFYLAGGVVAGIGYALVPHQYHPIVGASGAIAAVTGAYLILFPRSNVTIVYFYFLIGTYEIASLWFILFFFAYDLWANFGQSDGVAHMAHIGGTLFGCLICLMMLGVRLLPRDQFDVLALVQRWNKRRQYRDLVTRGFNPFDHAQAGKNPARPDAQELQRLELRSQIGEAVAQHQLDKAAQLYLQLKQLDPTQVLARQTQLDVANQLYAEQLYPQAADAYELFLRHYPKYERIEQVELILGLIYARYLSQAERARACLTRALERLHGSREREIAQEELSRLATPG